MGTCVVNFRVILHLDFILECFKVNLFFEIDYTNRAIIEKSQHI